MKRFKKYVIYSGLLMASVLFLSRCFFTNRFIKSDAEIEEHYKNAVIKPQYKACEINGRSEHYVVLSKSDTLPLLVMIHGAPGAWYGYMNLTDDTTLQKHFKMIAVDRLGYGKSDYGKAELSTEQQASAIEKIIAQENKSAKKVYLLGRSYGAPIAAKIAMNNQQLVEKLLMVSPVIDPTKEKFYWFSGIGRWRIVQWFLPEMLNVATAEKYSHSEEMKKMQVQWSQLKSPTYVLVGEDDQIADTANYSFARKYITNCSALFMKLQHTGHLITYQHPELITALLLDDTRCESASYVADRHKTENSNLPVKN